MIKSVNRTHIVIAAISFLTGCGKKIPDSASMKSWESESIASHRVRSLTNDEFQSYLTRAEEGDAEAAMVVAQRYLFKPRYEGSESDLDELRNHLIVLSWLRVAAVLGRADAQSDLHTFLYKSANEEDRKEARRWLEKSAAQGFPHSVDQLKKNRQNEP